MLYAFVEVPLTDEEGRSPEKLEEIGLAVGGRVVYVSTSPSEDHEFITVKDKEDDLANALRERGYKVEKEPETVTIHGITFDNRREEKMSKNNQEKTTYIADPHQSCKYCGHCNRIGDNPDRCANCGESYR
jgi:rubrerythrin